MNTKALIPAILVCAFAHTSSYAVTDPDSETPTLDKLNEAYDLDNPNRNYQNLEKLELIPGQRDSDDTRTQDLLQNNLNNQEEEEFDDYSHYNEDVDESELRNKAAQRAAQDATSMGQPSQDSNGNTKLKYSEKGTRKLSRDADGNVVVEVIDGGDMRESGISEEQVYSSELNNETHNQFGNIKDSYGDENKLYAAGSQNLSTLKNQGTKTGDAVAYRTILGSSDKALDTEIDESILDLSREQLKNLKEDPSEFFSSCTTTTETTTVGADGEIIEETTCTDIDDSNYDFCEIERKVSQEVVGETLYEGYDCLGGKYPNFDPSQVEHPRYWAYDGDYHNITLFSCVEGYFTASGNMHFSTWDLWEERITSGNIGTGRHLWSASTLEGKVNNGELTVLSGLIYPEEVDLDSSEWSWPMVSTTLFGTGMVIDGWTGFGHGVWMGPELQEAPAGGVFVKPEPVQDNERVVFTQTLKQSPSGCLDKTGHEVIMKTGEIDYETEESATAASMSAMSMTTASAASEEEHYCTFDGFSVMDERTKDYPQELLDELGPMFEGDTGNITWKANLDGYSCDPFKGEKICVANHDTGEQECFTWEELKDKFANRDPEKTCSRLDNANNCELIEQRCVESTRDEDGVCRIFHRDYECSTPVGGSSTAVTETNTCESIVPCAGGECDNTQNETNDDFNEAVGMASLLENMNADNRCNTGTSLDSCEVFPGTFGTCDRPTSGSIADAISLAGPNCCKDPNAVGIATYVKAAYQARQFEAVQNMETYAADAVKGAYDKIADTETFKTISKPITSAWESIGGNSSGATEAAGNYFENGMTELSNSMMKWMADNLPTDIAKSLFISDTTYNQAGEEIVTFGDPPEWSETMVDAGNFMQGLMTAYSYYTWIKMAIDIAFQCEEEEAEVAGQVSQKACVMVGKGDCIVSSLIAGCERRTYNYCCFNSIFARIVMEQAAEQLGRPLGEGNACRGLDYQELQQLDWSQIDLESEWIPLMFESGLLPDEMSEENLTGSGRTMNGAARSKVSIRTLERLGHVDDEVIQKMKDEVREPLDCSQYPRPAECYYRNPPGN
jgi:hypothetical protein